MEESSNKEYHDADVKEKTDPEVELPADTLSFAARTPTEEEMGKKSIMSSETQKSKIFFTATFLVALFFWAWALKNTISMDNQLDLGVVSFGSVLVSSSYMLGVLTSGSLAATSRLVQIATTGTQIFVAINYLLGAILGFTSLGRPGFGIYCVVFTGLWLAVAHCGRILINSVSVVGMGGEALPLSA